MAKNTGLAKILAIIGGLVILIQGVLALLNHLGIFSFGLGLPGEGGFLGSLGALVNAIIAIVVGILVLISTGVIKSSKTKVGFNGVIMLVLGILGIIFGSLIGGVLVLIGGILLLI